MSEWKTVRLGDVCEILDSKRVPITAHERKNGSYPYYGANGIQDYVADYIFDDELVLLAEDGGNFGSKEKPIAYRVSGKCWVNNHAHVLKPKECLDVDYLCDSIKFYDVSTIVNGATRQKLTQSAMVEMKIFLPPLETQKQIAKQLNKCTTLLAKHKQMLETYDTLIKSRFIEMFGDPYNNTKYPYKNVGEFTTVTSGGTPDRKNNEYWKNGKIPWVKTTELQNNELTEVEEFITQKGLDESSAKMMPKGTLLIAMYGQGKTRGMTAYLGIEASTNQACACILPSKEINQRYLWYYFILSYDKLRDLAKGGNQPNLNGNMIKSFPVLMPPIDMQNKYVSFVQQIDKSKFEIWLTLQNYGIIEKRVF